MARRHDWCEYSGVGVVGVIGHCHAFLDQLLPVERLCNSVLCTGTSWERFLVQGNRHLRIEYVL